jgi:hypothetical protein
VPGLAGACFFVCGHHAPRICDVTTPGFVAVHVTLREDRAYHWLGVVFIMFPIPPGSTIETAFSSTLINAVPALSMLN